MAERGVYLTMLTSILSTEKPITKERAYVMCLASSAAEKKLVDSVILEYFIPVDGGFSNKRAMEEIAALNILRESGKANGKKGGRPRKQNPKNKTTHL